MTDIICRMDANRSIIAYSEAAYKAFNRIKSGIVILISLKDQSKESEQQRKFWFVLANLLFESQEYYKDFDSFRKVLLIRLGFCDFFKQADGTMIPVAWSLKWGNLGNSEFSRLVNLTLDFAVAMGFNRESLLAETREVSGHDPRL